MHQSHAITTDFFESLRPGQVLEPLFDAIPDTHFFIKDIKSRLMGGSHSLAISLRAKSMSEVIGKNDFEILPDFLSKHFIADDQKVMSTGKPLINKIELLTTGTGSLDWLCTTKIPLWGKNGKIIGMAGVARTISDTDSIYSSSPEMKKIVNYLKEHFREKVYLPQVAERAGLSVSSQERLFKKIFGITPLMYLRKMRLNEACNLLRESTLEITEIAENCGFNDQTNMTRAFRKDLKITPNNYRLRFTHGRPSKKK